MRLPFSRYTPSRRLATVFALAGLAVTLAVLLSVQALQLLHDRSTMSRRAAAARLDEIARAVSLRTEYQLLTPMATAVGNAALTDTGGAMHGPSVRVFADRVARQLAPCVCVAPGGIAIRVHASGHVVTVNRTDSAATRLATWVADTLVKQVALPHLASANLVGRPTSAGEAPGKGGRLVFGLLATVAPLPVRLFGYIGRFTPADSIEDVFAVELQPLAFLIHSLSDSTIRPDADNEPAALLPPSTLDLTDAGGRVLDAGVGARWLPGVRVRALPPDVGGLQLRVFPVTKPADLTGSPVSSGGGGRLLVVVALFGVTVALSVVALLQLRGEFELARRRARFVSGVSHELRTPLAQIRLFAELLRDTHPTVQSKRYQYARIIDEEAQRLTYLVDNVLVFAALEDAVRGPRRQDVSLSDILRETIDRFSPLAASRSAIIHASIPPGVHVHANDDALRRILLNVLDNAMKYGPSGQTIDVDLTILDGEAQITVDDAGPGIPAADRDRVFEPFVRLDEGPAPQSGGSGIGLTIVRDLIAAMGGSVGIDDAPRQGARIRMRFPLPSQSAAYTSAPERSASTVPVAGVM